MQAPPSFSRITCGSATAPQSARRAHRRPRYRRGGRCGHQGRAPFSVVAGNPAAVVKTLDPEHPRRTRAELLADPEGLEVWLRDLDNAFLGENSVLGWLRALLWPRRGDWKDGCWKVR